MKPRHLWIGYSVVAAVAILWNFWANYQISKQGEICRKLNKSIAKQTDKIHQHDDDRTYRSQAKQKAYFDRRLLFSMYSVCRSAEDFIPVHPDQIQFNSRSISGAGSELFFYVPPGNHQLVIRFCSMDADQAARFFDPDLAVFWGDLQEKTKTISLKGGTSYLAQLTFFKDGKSTDNQLGDEVSELRVSLSEDQIVEFPFDVSELSYLKRYSAEDNGLRLPAEIPDWFFRLVSMGRNPPPLDSEVKLLTQGRGLQLSDGSKKEIRIGLYIRSDGPARILPTSAHFEHLIGQTHFTNARSLFDYLEYDETNGWYFYRDPDQVNRLRSKQPKDGNNE